MHACCDVPGAILGLRVEQVLNAAPPARIRDGHLASLMQDGEDLPRRVCIAGTAIQSIPAAIRLLLRGQPVRQSFA
jgi:hypothetical protein